MYDVSATHVDAYYRIWRILSYVLLLYIALFFLSISLLPVLCIFFFFFSSRRRHTRSYGDWSSDVCSSDLQVGVLEDEVLRDHAAHGEREDVDQVEVERLDEGVGVIGGLFDGAGNTSCGGTEIGRASCRERVERSVVGRRVRRARRHSTMRV